MVLLLSHPRCTQKPPLHPVPGVSHSPRWVELVAVHHRLPEVRTRFLLLLGNRYRGTLTPPAFEGLAAGTGVDSRPLNRRHSNWPLKLNVGQQLHHRQRLKTVGLEEVRLVRLVAHVDVDRAIEGG